MSDRVERILSDLAPAFDECEAAVDRALRLARIEATSRDCVGEVDFDVRDEIREAAQDAADAAELAKRNLGHAIRRRLEKERTE